MNRREFHRMSAMAAGGILAPGIFAGAWRAVDAPQPRFQLATSSDFVSGAILLEVDGPIAASAIATTTLVAGSTHWWRIATDGRSHYHGRIFDPVQLRQLADMVNAVTIPYLESVHATGVGTEPEVPATFGLDQNYPNPFNPVTTIPFTIDVAGPASLRIYDLLGREVASLVDGDLPWGPHEAHWDASGLSSGTYIAVLRSGSRTQTRRMTLIK